MRVLITGAAGYLGRAVVARLRDEHELTLADIHAGATDEGWVTLDVTQPDDVRAAVSGHDAVVHLVGLVRGRATATLRDFSNVMVLGTWSVADACALAGIPTLINISSVAADGFVASTSRQRTVSDSPVFSPEDLHYALAKHLGEAVVRAYSCAFGMRIVNLRLGMLAGDGANPDPVRASDDPYWFVHVDRRDAADAIAKALSSEASGTYHVLAGRPDTVWDWTPASRDFGYSPQHNWTL